MSLFGVFVVSYWCIIRCCIVLVFYALLHRIGVLFVVALYWCIMRCCSVVTWIIKSGQVISVTPSRIQSLLSCLPQTHHP